MIKILLETTICELQKSKEIKHGDNDRFKCCRNPSDIITEYCFFTESKKEKVAKQNRLDLRPLFRVWIIAMRNIKAMIITYWFIIYFCIIKKSASNRVVKKASCQDSNITCNLIGNSNILWEKLTCLKLKKLPLKINNWNIKSLRGSWNTVSERS